MFPEETATASSDLRAMQLLPVHWARYVLANHPWSEPVQRLLVAAPGAPFDVLTPKFGASITLGAASVTNAWWDAVQDRSM